jgi:hypothetical protein
LCFSESPSTSLNVSSPASMTGTATIMDQCLFPTPTADWYPQDSTLEFVGGALPVGNAVSVRPRHQAGNTTDMYITGSGSDLYEKSHGDDQVWSGYESTHTGPAWWTVVARPAKRRQFPRDSVV